MPLTYPPALAEQLEYDKILADLSSRCTAMPAKERALSLPLLTDLVEIQRLLSEVTAMQMLQEEGFHIAIPEYRDTKPAFKWFGLSNSVLPLEDILEFRHQMRAIISWFDLFDPEMQDRFAACFLILSQTEPLRTELASLDRVFDEEGEIKDHASPELKKIRNQIRQQERALQRSFDALLEKYRREGILTDSLESVRSGRRVLTLPAEHKRRIPGLILDQSSSGRTVFIQPSEAIEIENNLFEIKNEERQEINRILKTLTAELAMVKDVLQNHLEVITQMDLVRAKTSQASALRASMPQVVDLPGLNIQDGRHPLLLLKHKGRLDAVVPFDLLLNAETQVLVISGPNAGGKSITLKAVGLLSLMCQSGLLIPASPETQMGIYHIFLGDIGDQQSLEQDLSTYTSHLQNMREFVKAAGSKALFLIDEFGSGTEPAIGGAIAEAILQELLTKKAQGVVTTHYGNLKVLAAQEKGCANAAMEFDRQALRPTYRLQIGKPGSSFAFEMANRSGLPHHLIKQARKKMGKKEGKLEYLLTGMQRDKQKLEEKLKQATQREKDLDRLIANYEQLQRDLEVKRKKFKLEEKTARLQRESQANQALQKVIRELREKEKLSKAKKLAQELKDSKAELTHEISELQEDILARAPAPKDDKPLAVGDSVRMKLGGMTGTIDRIRNGKATVLVGNMRLDAAISELERSRAPIDLNPVKSVRTDFENAKVHTKLDIRGLRRSDALRRIEKFVDQALVANLSTVEIIHGKGHGTLKQAVQDKLKEYQRTFETYHPAAEQGGDGVTFINLT